MIRRWRTTVQIDMDMPERSTGEEVREKIARALDRLSCAYDIADPAARGFVDGVTAFWRHYGDVKKRHDELSREIDRPWMLLAAVRERWIAAEVPEAPPAGQLKLVEHDTIRRALLETNGNKTRAARILGVKRTTLVEKIRRMEKAA